jgi:2-dehydropantoate 2-reductase
MPDVYCRVLTPMAPSRLIILGAGAIGASIGALLAEQGVPVVLVARGAHGQALRERGLDLRTPRGNRNLRVPVVDTLKAASPTPQDLVAVATMAQDAANAVAGLDPQVPVLSLQNGTFALDLLVARGHAVLASVVWVPAERRAPGVVALAGDPHPGAIQIGAWPQGDHPWARWLVTHLAAAGFVARVEANIAPWVRAKQLANLAGIVVALCDEPPMAVVDAAQAEARAVWTAAGETWEEVEALLERVGPLHTLPVDGLPRIGGSTRHALARGDVLETAALHGPIIAAGARFGVPTPVNAGLVVLAAQAHIAGAMTADALLARLSLSASG